jgi:hypothetical protein
LVSSKEDQNIHSIDLKPDGLPLAPSQVREKLQGMTFFPISASTQPTNSRKCGFAAGIGPHGLLVEENEISDINYV